MVRDKGVGVVRDKELKLEDGEVSHTLSGAMSFLKDTMTYHQLLCGKDMTGEQLQLWDAAHFVCVCLPLKD